MSLFNSGVVQTISTIPAAPTLPDEEFRAKVYFGRARLLGYVANIVTKTDRQRVIIEDFMKIGDWDDSIKRGLQEGGNGYRIDPIELLSITGGGFHSDILDTLTKEYGDRHCFSVTIQPVSGSEEFKLNVRPTAVSRSSIFMDAGLSAWRFYEKIDIAVGNISAITKVDFG